MGNRVSKCSKKCTDMKCDDLVLKVTGYEPSSQSVRSCMLPEKVTASGDRVLDKIFLTFQEHLRGPMIAGERTN